MAPLLENRTEPPCVVPRADAPEVKRRLDAALGFVSPAAQYTACIPWMVDLDHVAHIPPIRTLDRPTAELGALSGAAASGCWSALSAVRAASFQLGYSESQVRGVEEGTYEGTSGRVRVGVEVIRRVVTLEAGAADFELAREAGYGAEEVAEMVMVGALSAMASRVSASLSVPAVEVSAPRRGFFALVGRYFQRRGAAGKRDLWRGERSEAADVRGPFSRLLGPFVPSPAAREVRGLIEGCLTSGVCPPRGRLLAMAVVAREAHDEVLAGEFRGLMGVEGISARVATEALAYLDAPELYDFERCLLEYARVSVRGSAELQSEKARVFAAGRAPELVVDALGAVALANGLARLSLLRGR